MKFIKQSLTEQRYSPGDVVFVAIETSYEEPSWDDASFAVVRKDIGREVEIQYLDDEADTITLDKNYVSLADRRTSMQLRRTYPWFFESKDSIDKISKISTIKESVEIDCPYDITAEYFRGKRKFRQKSLKSFIIKKGEPITVSFANTYNDGSISFYVEGIQYESLLYYDSAKEAREDGWPV